MYTVASHQQLNERREKADERVKVDAANGVDKDEGKGVKCKEAETSVVSGQIAQVISWLPPNYLGSCNHSQNRLQYEKKREWRHSLTAMALTWLKLMYIFRMQLYLRVNVVHKTKELGAIILEMLACYTRLAYLLTNTKLLAALGNCL